MKRLGIIFGNRIKDRRTELNKFWLAQKAGDRFMPSFIKCSGVSVFCNRQVVGKLKKDNVIYVHHLM